MKRTSPCYWQPREQLELHPFCCPWATQNLTHHVSPRRKIKFKNRLASSPHVSKHCLSEMPPQELIDRPSRVLEQLLVEMFTSDARFVFCETDNLIIILRTMSEMELHVHTVVMLTSRLITIS